VPLSIVIFSLIISLSYLTYLFLFLSVKSDLFNSLFKTPTWGSQSARSGTRPTGQSIPATARRVCLAAIFYYSLFLLNQLFIYLIIPFNYVVSYLKRSFYVIQSTHLPKLKYSYLFIIYVVISFSFFSSVNPRIDKFHVKICVIYFQNNEVISDDKSISGI